MILLVSFLIANSHPAQATTAPTWWSSFCARHLVADDPYQYETLTIDELVFTYFYSKPPQVLIDEMRKRLTWQWPLLSEEDREIITKTLNNEWWIR